MIRPLTCLCMLLAAGSGLYLYQTKHQAQLLDREITRTVRATETARDRIGVLRAEWALLNEPERLSELAQHHLQLRTLTPSQFVSVSELALRLPAPVAPGTRLDGVDDTADSPVADADPAPQITPTLAAPIQPVGAIAIRQPVQLNPPAAMTEHHAAPTPDHRRPVKLGAVSQPAAPASPSYVAARTQAPSFARPPVIQRVGSLSPDPAVPAVTSALGTKSMVLAPPVPFSATAAAFDPR